MSILTRQYKQAWASLKKKPSLILAVIITMGLTLGALLCAITLNYLLLVEPLPYPEQDRLYVADHRILDSENKTKTVSFSYPGLVDLYKNKEAFDKSAIIYYGQDVITSHQEQPLVNVTYTTPELHSFFASPMAKGRMFDDNEGLDSNIPVAILNYNTWQKKYAGIDDILEQKITIGGVSYRIIGVLADSFVESELYVVGRDTHIWLPWDFNPAKKDDIESFTNITPNYKFLGLIKKGLNSSQVEQILTPGVSEKWQEGVTKFSFFKKWSVKIEIRALKNVVLGNSSSITSMLLFGVIGLVLIACVNISNLFMARTAEKQRNMAIQAAVGATRKDLFRMTFFEISILMFISILVAIIIAQTGFYLIQQHLNAVLPRAAELSLNMITFSMAITLCFGLAFCFAKLSVRLINYKALNLTLQSSGKGSGIQVSKKTRQRLIASQVALATILVFANVTLLKESVNKIIAPNGFNTSNLSTLILSYSGQNLPSNTEIEPIMKEVIEKLEFLPQVESISQSSSPLDGFGIKALTVENEKFTPYFKRVDEKYFQIIEQSLIQGDNLTLIDRKDKTSMVVVNQAFANQLKEDGDVLGMHLVSMGEPDFIVKGVVKAINIPGETAFGSDEISEQIPRVYAANSLSEKIFLIKTKDNQTLSRAQLAKLVSEIDSRYMIFNYLIASESLRTRLFVEITTAASTSVLAFLVLLLAGIGIFGVLSYGTQLRKFELGTRMAIGATRKDIITLIIRDNTKPFFYGVLSSLVLTSAIFVLYQSEMKPFFTLDSISIIVATISLILFVVLLACYFPLRKYINVSPINTLRGNE